LLRLYRACRNLAERISRGQGHAHRDDEQAEWPDVEQVLMLGAAASGH